MPWRKRGEKHHADDQCCADVRRGERRCHRADWYVKELGFTYVPFPHTPPYVFAILHRDSVEIMLMRIEGYQKPDLTSLRPAGLWDAYIRMVDVVDFYQSFRDKPYLWRPLKTQPYGDTEFEVRDPNGYILVFSG